MLPSPNGAALSLAAHAHAITLAGCLRNAASVARALKSIGGTVALIPAGERGRSGALRPAIEDRLGAGAIARALDPATLGPEARAVAAAFTDARADLRSVLHRSASGRELGEIGYAHDVDVAARLNISEAAPRLVGDGLAAMDATPAP